MSDDATEATDAVDLASVSAGISQLFSNYTDAVWRKDHVAFAECFTPDGEWRIGGVVLRGRSRIAAQIKSVLGLYRRVLVTMRPPILEVSRGAATGRALLSETCIFNDGRVITPIGTYFDRYALFEGRWRFSWRLFQTEYAGPADYSGPFFENPDFGPPPAMPPLDTMPIDHTGTHARTRG
jgi:hypothetical protein